jgi:hypothetical protein
MSKPTARDLESINSGDSYRKELSRMETFADVIKKVQENSEKSVQKFKTKTFIGEIYSSKLYTAEEIAVLTGDASDSILSSLGEDSSYRGYRVYIPAKCGIYPNVTGEQIKEYNKVIAGNLIDLKTRKIISAEDYLESKSEEQKKEFKTIKNRIERFPIFFQRGSESEGSYPNYCKIEEYDAGTPLNYGIFKEIIIVES